MHIVLFGESATAGFGSRDTPWQGIATELLARGHAVRVVPATADLTAALANVDLVVVPAGHDPDLVARVGRHHTRAHEYALLLHDAGHRSISDPASLAALDLRHYDGVLAGGPTVAHLYVERGWTRDAWAWPTSVDVRVFYPRRPPDHPGRVVDAQPPQGGDVVWIGRVGSDATRRGAFEEFFITPVKRLGVRAAAYGPEYPPSTLDALAAADIEYRGWIPHELKPEVFAQFKATVYLPPGPYVGALQGIPTAPLFEAMACGIPLVSSRWHDVTGVFGGHTHFLVADTGAEMAAHLGALLSQPSLGAELARRAFRDVRAHHTCAHRVDALLAIASEIRRRREPAWNAVLTPAV